jgi:hypothetical protein
MRALKIGEGSNQQTYICVHWKTFPPPGAGGDAENLRANEAIDNAQYARLQLWQRDCGLLAMKEEKCLSCPHRRKVVWKTRGPYLRDPEGIETPVVDMAAGEASPRNRHMANIFRRPGTVGSHQPAAWRKDADDKADG